MTTTTVTLPDLIRESRWADAGEFLAAGFTSPDLVSAAAATLPHLPVPVEVPEGPSFFLEVSPGSARLRAQDLAKAERTANRDRDRQTMPGEFYTVDPETGEITAVPERAPSREVVEWSRKSRARMVYTLSTLDYRPLFAAGMPVMVTLTYPGEWESVCPSGKVIKRHLDLFRKRWLRRWGFAPVGLWKLEFQRRGAPHLHLLLSHPPVSAVEFRLWARSVWADVVAHSDPVEYLKHLDQGVRTDLKEGARMRDVKRVAVYFSKHSSKASGSKEYQHSVPELWQSPGAGPGRFWGFWGLESVRAGVRLSARDFVRVRRLLRRVAASHGRRVGRGGRMAGCFVVTNDGPGFAFTLSRALALAD